MYFRVDICSGLSSTGKKKNPEARRAQDAWHLQVVECGWHIRRENERWLGKRELNTVHPVRILKSFAQVSAVLWISELHT